MSYYTEFADHNPTSMGPVEILTAAAALVAAKGLNPEGHFMKPDGVPCIHGAILSVMGVPNEGLLEHANTFGDYAAYCDYSGYLLGDWLAGESNDAARDETNGREWAAKLFQERLAFFNN